jgi:hypothetical protein
MRWREHRETSRNRDQPSAVHDEGAAIDFSRRYQFGFEPDAACEIGGPRFFRQERISARLNHKPVTPKRLERTTDPIASFEQRHFQWNFSRRRDFAQPVRGAQSGDSSADYCDAFDLRFGVRRNCSREKSFISSHIS